MLHQCLESIVQKVQSGVVINFEKIGPDPPSLESDNVDNKPNGGKGKLRELVAGFLFGLKNLENLNLEKSQYPWGNLGKSWNLVIFNKNPGKML